LFFKVGKSVHVRIIPGSFPIRIRGQIRPWIITVLDFKPVKEVIIVSIRIKWSGIMRIYFITITEAIIVCIRIERVGPMYIYFIAIGQAVIVCIIIIWIGSGCLFLYVAEPVDIRIILGSFPVRIRFQIRSWVKTIYSLKPVKQTIAISVRIVWISANRAFFGVGQFILVCVRIENANKDFPAVAPGYKRGPTA